MNGHPKCGMFQPFSSILYGWGFLIFKGMGGVARTGDAGGFKVCDLPGACGGALVDAGVAEGAAHGCSVVAAVNLCAGGDDGDGADELDFGVGEIYTAEDEGVSAEAIKLDGLGVYLTGPGDADIIV